MKRGLTSPSDSELILATTPFLVLFTSSTAENQRPYWVGWKGMTPLSFYLWHQKKLSSIEDRGQTNRVTALPRPHWPLTLTYELDFHFFQSQASYFHDLHTKNFLKFKRQSLTTFIKVGKYMCEYVYCWPRSGIASDVLGTLFSISRRKTEMATRMETPSETFSPLSAGSRKTISRTPDRSKHGKMMNVMKNVYLRRMCSFTYSSGHDSFG